MASGSAFTGVSLLKFRYLDFCRRREVFPNPSIISALSEAQNQESRRELCVLDLALDRLKTSDLHVLIVALAATNLSGIDVVDVHEESSNVWLDGKCVLALLLTVNEKLRVVDIQHWLLWKDVLRDISRRGLACCILNLRFAPIVQLNLSGNFLQLHTLNLDFSATLSCFRINCFSCMPNLMRLSMCETRISNLWMASTALSKLPSLVELRFQNCLCCYDTGACATLFGDTSAPPPGCKNRYSFQPLSVIRDNYTKSKYSFNSQKPNFMLSDGEPFTCHESHAIASSDSFDIELDFLNFQQELSRRSERSVSTDFDFDGDPNKEIPFDHDGGQGNDSPVPFQTFQEVSYAQIRDTCDYDDGRYIDTIGEVIDNKKILSPISDEYHGLNLVNQASCSLVWEECFPQSLDSQSPNGTTETLHMDSKKYFSHHPSPICFERHYREYMIASLPQLNVLDNLLVTYNEREEANCIFKQHFELLPYQRPVRESITSILSHREADFSKVTKRSSHLKQSSTSKGNNHFFIRSLSSAKINSSPWPHMCSLSKLEGISTGDMKDFRPRQFEYHPTNPSMMVFGTLDGELVVLNHESGKPVGFVSSDGPFNSILGLCWLKRNPSKLIAGSDNGSLKLFDVRLMSPVNSDRYHNQDAVICSFEDFEHLTSVHINSTDDTFLVSGFSKHVALYDIGTGKRLQILKDLHLEHINVVKFSHNSPSLFATASFDQDVKLWDLRQGFSHPCYTVSSPRGNVMVCFSPDDHYLLSSAVDNEVRQHLAVDGRLHLAFDIAPTGSGQNYTRSYYMNGRDYVISGSSEENVVRVCCSQTGRRLRDIFMESQDYGNSTFVQSLRGDPFRVFHMSVLTTYLRPSSKSEIIRVNMLSSGDDDIDDNQCFQPLNPSLHMGG